MTGVSDASGAAGRFTADERRALSPYFTNVDRDVFALRNLPEVVKGALFARYSRSAKSLRRLFLDEFLAAVPAGRVPDAAVGVERAHRLYERVFGDYGDDSVAQLGAAHVACEGVSNVLTKVLERGRLAAYLEQSTRYVPYTDRPGGRWKYLVPDELDGLPLRERYVSTLDDAFETYRRWLEPAQDHFRRRYPNTAGDSEGVYRAVIRAKALDTLRGLLPAATRSNVGIFASGQAFEALLLRMRAHPLTEARACADRMLAELRKLIPAFSPGSTGRTAAYGGAAISPKRAGRPARRRSGCCTAWRRPRSPRWPSPTSTPTARSRWSRRRCTSRPACPRASCWRRRAA